MPKARRGTDVGPNLARVFVDSSGWIALFRERDGRHREADALFEKALAFRTALLTTNLIVAEVHRFILFRVGIAAASRALAAISSHPRVSVAFPGRGDHEAAQAWLTKLADQRITYTDAVSFAVMEKARCDTALAFDHDFAVAGFRLWQHVG